MNIITQLLDKTLYVVFFMSLFNVIRHGFLFYRHISKPDFEKYAIKPKEMLFLGLSLAFIITVIFKGIGI